MSTEIDSHPALLAREEVQALPPYSFGRDPATVRRDTGFAGTVIKLASNEGAEGPLSGALAALRGAYALAQRYPEPHSRALCSALAELHGVKPDRIVVGSGVCSLISHLSSAYLRPGDAVVMGHPTFHLYRLEALRMGATPVAVPLLRHGVYDLVAMREAVGPRTRLLYVCTPNNPTGGLVPRAALEAFLDGLPAHVLPIVDQAYFEYVDDPDYPDPMRITLRTSRPVVILRTFSKIFGLAGLRVGYALAPQELVQTLRRVQNPYEVNRIAQVGALASLDVLAELSERRQRNLTIRAELLEGLRRLELMPLPSQGNFACVRVGQAKAVAAALERRGVIVRPLDAMGDPASVRITVGTREENALLLAQLAAALGERSDMGAEAE